MNCRLCGVELPEGTITCSRCGASVTPGGNTSSSQGGVTPDFPNAPMPPKKKSGGKIALIIAGVIVFTGIIGMVVNNGSSGDSSSGTASETNAANTVGESKQSSSQTATQKPTQSPTQAPTEEPKDALELVGGMDSVTSYREYFALYIEGTVKNNSNKTYSYVQITFSLYDSSGAKLGTAIDNLNNLAPGEIWKFKALGMDSGSEEIATYRLDEIKGY